MMPSLAMNLTVMIGCAVFFYRAGEIENSSRLAIGWAVASIVISLLIWQGLRWNWLEIVLAQFGLFVGITVFRMMRENS